MWTQSSCILRFAICVNLPSDTTAAGLAGGAARVLSRGEAASTEPLHDPADQKEEPELSQSGQKRKALTDAATTSGVGPATSDGLVVEGAKRRLSPEPEVMQAKKQVAWKHVVFYPNFIVFTSSIHQCS